MLAECDHGMDPRWCSLCLHPGDYVSRAPRGSKHDDAGRRVPRELGLARRIASRPDPFTVRVEQIMAGKRCELCGHERLTNVPVQDLDHPRAGMCRCERLKRFEDEVQAINEWSEKLSKEGIKAGRWASMQALRRVAIRAGRYEPSEYMGEAMPLIATVGLEARQRFEEPIRWAPSRGSVADELPV